jgi:hypothetical protein
MSNAKNEAEKILDSMPVAMQEQAIKALIAVFEQNSDAFPHLGIRWGLRSEQCS